MLRRSFLATPILALASRARAESEWSLVTPDEVARATAYTGPSMVSPRTRGLGQPPGPAIVIDQPDVSHPLHPPLSFRVRFVPGAGAEVDPRSFHALYGFLGIDITSRLLAHARLGAAELTADNVDIPAGSHTVTIQIADLQGRQNSRTFQFTIV